MQQLHVCFSCKAAPDPLVWIECTHCDECELEHATCLLLCAREDMSFPAFPSSAASCVLMAEAPAPAAGLRSSSTRLWSSVSRLRCSCSSSSAPESSLSPRFSSNSLFTCPSPCCVFCWGVSGCWWGKAPWRSADSTPPRDSHRSSRIYLIS